MTEDQFVALRDRMVDQQIRARGVVDPRVLAAVRQVPRHLFIPQHLWDQAYNDYPLPIGADQTISQPYIVALMTEILEVKETDRILELGTGSGYQAAILAELAAQVFSIDRMGDLARHAKEMLDSLGYKNVQIRVGDGTLGWPEESPFDAIMVTAAAPMIPARLVGQLKDGGGLVIPVGDRYSQLLQVIVKSGETTEETPLCRCVFVPLIGRNGWEEER